MNIGAGFVDKLCKYVILLIISLFPLCTWNLNPQHLAYNSDLCSTSEMASENGMDRTLPLITTNKPAYIKNSEMQLDKTNKIGEFEMYEAVHKIVGDDILCIQLERDLWRVYLKSNESRSVLLVQGIEIRNITVQVYDSNPYSTGAANAREKVLKVTICGLPLSVDDSAVLEMLQSFDVTIKSSLKYENIRNPDTHRMTNVLNGNRFLYISPLPENKSLPRNATCAKLKCRIYHHDQIVGNPKVQCFNCWEHGHQKQHCKNVKVCRVCKEPGHTPGSPECPHYKESQDDVVVFQGKSNPLSNFFPCDLHVFGERHKSAEHAYQLTKAIRSSNPDAAQKVRDAETALEAKRIGHTVPDPPGWDEDKETVMEEIVAEKVEQIAEVKAKIENLSTSTVFAEGTFDMHWGTGLDVNATLHTTHSKWPGKNRLGKLYQKIITKRIRKLRSSSVPRKGTGTESQSNIEDFLTDLRKHKKNTKGNKGNPD